MVLAVEECVYARYTISTINLSWQWGGRSKRENKFKSRIARPRLGELVNDFVNFKCPGFSLDLHGREFPVSYIRTQIRQCFFRNQDLPS